MIHGRTVRGKPFQTASGALAEASSASEVPSPTGWRSTLQPRSARTACRMDWGVWAVMCGAPEGSKARDVLVPPNGLDAVMEAIKVERAW